MSQPQIDRRRFLAGGAAAALGVALLRSEPAAAICAAPCEPFQPVGIFGCDCWDSSPQFITVPRGYRWETGQVTLEALLIAAKALGCSPRQLLPA